MKNLGIAGLGLLLSSAAVPAPAKDAFETKNREHGAYVDRYGDVPLGAVIRTDERYNRNGLFLGPRGWDYWNYLADPQP